MTKTHPLMADDGHVILQAPTAQAMVDLAQRHRAANNIAIELLSAAGGTVENLLARIPRAMRRPMELATARALEASFAMATRSRGKRLPDGSERANAMIASAFGALGGLGGIATALAEMPFSVTLLIRSVQSIALQYGFDPNTEETRKDCLLIISAAGPLDRDDGADLAFVAARMTLTGVSLNAMLSRAAPQVSAILMQRLATRAVPVLGAAAGAATNYAFSRYYQEMAHIHFGLRRLSEDSGREIPDLIAELRGLIDAR